MDFAKDKYLSLARLGLKRSAVAQIAQAAAKDTCVGFAKAHGIAATELYNWNTVLGPGGRNCSVEFQAGYYYCIAFAAPASVTLATSVGGDAASGSATMAPPSPAPTLATFTSVTTATRTLSRPSSNSAPSSGSAVPVPTPIQPHSVPADCSAYQIAKSDESCPVFVKRVGITEANLYIWNKVLGVDGVKCSTGLWHGYNHCVGVS